MGEPPKVNNNGSGQAAYGKGDSEPSSLRGEVASFRLPTFSNQRQQGPKDNDHNKHKDKDKDTDKTDDSKVNKKVSNETDPKEGQGQIDQQKSQEQTADIKATQQSSQATQLEQVKKIETVSRLMGDMLGSMQVGETKTQQIALVDFKAGEMVPQSLIGTKMEVKIEPNKGVVVDFKVDSQKLPDVQKLMNANAAKQIAENLQKKGFESTSIHNIMINGEPIVKEAKQSSLFDVVAQAGKGKGGDSGDSGKSTAQGVERKSGGGSGQGGDGGAR